MLTINYNPDVLTCLANLSNDEVFTPPQLVHQILDNLPQALFTNPDTTFLDPMSKSGVFLREIAKRLIAGLQDQIPDLQERINHIFQKQLFGIAITELTSLLTRRTLYCSKVANHDKNSLCTTFENQEGNILYPTTDHTWHDGKCLYCNANETTYGREDGLEQYAYPFIHTDNPHLFFNNMRFDVIIGNPPYQMNDGGGMGSSAKPIYQLFVQQAKKLNPRYLAMIIPARWYAGGKGLDSFRKEMLKDRHIKELHDYVNASDCFTGVEIKGGVCYFLWAKDHQGPCQITSYRDGKVLSVAHRPLREEGADILIRNNEAISIYHKVKKQNEESFKQIVSSRKPFGFVSNYKGVKKKSFSKAVNIYANQSVGYVSREEITKNIHWVDDYKVYVPKAIGVGDASKDIIKPILGMPNTCCTETYLVIGPVANEKRASNIISYINTKFFHFMFSLKKVTQNTSAKVYDFVPMQDFDKTWTDKKLYQKYGLTAEEISYIDALIRPMP